MAQKNYFKCFYSKTWFPSYLYNKEGNPVTILLNNEDEFYYLGFSNDKLPDEEYLFKLQKKEALAEVGIIEKDKTKKNKLENNKW